VIHVAFNKKAGRAPLMELLHNDSVLRNREEAMRRTTVLNQPRHAMKRKMKPIDSPHLNAASDRSDCGKSDTRLLSIVSTDSDTSEPILKGMPPSN
jgi:hypothetical protein